MGDCCTPTKPTQAGFVTFVRTNMAIDASVLPDDSPFIPQAYCTALGTVNRFIQLAAPYIYPLAVYNLGGAWIINIAQDLPGAPNVKGSKPPVPYFTNLRQKWNIYGFVPGVIQSSSDEGTSNSFVVPDQFQNLTIGDLQLLKTPWGQAYLGIAQSWGSDLWGIS